MGSDAHQLQDAIVGGARLVVKAKLVIAERNAEPKLARPRARTRTTHTVAAAPPGLLPASVSSDLSRRAARPAEPPCVTEGMLLGRTRRACL